MIEKNSEVLQKKAIGAGTFRQRQRKGGILIHPGTEIFQMFILIASNIVRKSDK